VWRNLIRRYLPNKIAFICLTLDQRSRFVTRAKYFVELGKQRRTSLRSSDHMKTLILKASLLIVALVCFTGCDNASHFYVGSLEVNRSGWDSLFVRSEFVSDPKLGVGTSVFPDVISFTVFDAAYDTLYTGDSGAISISDKDLGNSERLLVEVCGYFQQRTACDQRAFTASPKRALAQYEVLYPEDSTGFERGRIETSVSFERQISSSTEWESIRPSSRKELFVEVYEEANPASSVRIPVGRSNLRFIMSRYAGYRDLRFNIQSSMMDADTAAVHFDLYVRLGDDPMLVESETVVLRQKTERERQAEVRLIVERAGSQVLERVSGFFGVRRAYVFVNDWTYESLDRAYKADFEIHWQDSFRGEWSDMTGEVHVRVDGTLGTYTMRRASERAEDRWLARVGQATFELQPLFPELVIEAPVEEETKEVEQNRPRRRR